VGVSKPKYSIKESVYLLPRLAFFYAIVWFTYSHVWLSFMLYFGLLTPMFGFPLCYILVYLLPRLAFLYAHKGKPNVGVNKPKYNIKESQTWE
jgi:hypothetical protein